MTILTSALDRLSRSPPACLARLKGSAEILEHTETQVDASSVDSIGFTALDLPVEKPGFF